MKAVYPSDLRSVAVPLGRIFGHFMRIFQNITVEMSLIAVYNYLSGIEPNDLINSVLRFLSFSRRGLHISRCWDTDPVQWNLILSAPL